MALANLTYVAAGDTPRGRAFDVDLGTVNRYYRFAIGDETRVTSSGLPTLVQPSYVSELFGPVPDSTMGRIRIVIPNQHFNRGSYRVQLKSFRDENLSGPAVSEVVATMPTSSAMSVSGLEAQAVRRAFTMSAVPYPYRADPGPVSHAMFLQGLLGLLPKVLPGIGNLLGGLFGGAAKAPSPSPGAGQGGLDAVLKMFASNPEIQKLLGDLISGLVKAKSNGASVPPAGAQALSADGYSRAMFAPAIMAILSQVLTPETVQAIVKSAPELIAATGKVLTEVGNVANEQVKQHLEHLLKLHNTDDPTLERLLGSMSLARMGPTKQDLRYRRVRSVTLDFGEVVPLMVGGVKRISYVMDRDLRFPVVLAAPRPLGDASLELAVTHALTNEEMYRRSVKLRNVQPGPLPKVPRIPREIVSRLTVGAQYFVRVTLTWRSGKGELVGTSRIQAMTPCSGTIFFDMERTGDPVALTDARRFREYWHRLWHARLTEDVRRWELEVKYVYGWEPASTTNTRTETLVKLTEPQGRKATAMLKGGMLLSPAVLNELLPRLFDRAPLAPGELAAMYTSTFADRVNSSARTRVTIKGRPGASVAVWVLPDIALHRLRLRRASKIDPNGQITAFDDYETAFPLPVAAHIVGTRSRT